MIGSCFSCVYMYNFMCTVHMCAFSLQKSGQARRIQPAQMLAKGMHFITRELWCRSLLVDFHIFLNVVLPQGSGICLVLEKLFILQSVVDPPQASVGRTEKGMTSRLNLLSRYSVASHTLH